MKIMIFIKWLFFLVLLHANIDLIAQDDYTLCATRKGIKYEVTGDVGSIFHWTVEGGRIVSDPHANIITIDWDNIPGDYKISVYEETAKSCKGNNMIINIKINESPFVNMGKVKNICEGGQVEFNPGEGFNTYLWQDGSSQPTYTASENGIYWVEVTNRYGCSFRDSVLLVTSLPPNIQLGKDTMLCAPNELVLDAGYFDGLYVWHNGSNTQTIIAQEGDGQIWVKVTDSNGCIGTDTIQILNCTYHFNLFIPNAFTPNDDGRNDYWLIKGHENYPNISVKVFDSWGNQVFQSDQGYSQPWDGTWNGKKLPVNAYYYVINLGDGSKEIVGSITLIR
ncbi:MAG: gliding motility-associated C-terminal domain-containing protein [Bacteroidales bacterium]